eukprot:PhF_6_TR14094/c1_g1_i2/m.22523
MRRRKRVSYNPMSKSFANRIVTTPRSTTSVRTMPKRNKRNPKAKAKLHLTRRTSRRPRRSLKLHPPRSKSNHKSKMYLPRNKRSPMPSNPRRKATSMTKILMIFKKQKTYSKSKCIKRQKKKSTNTKTEKRKNITRNEKEKLN